MLADELVHKGFFIFSVVIHFKFIMKLLPMVKGTLQKFKRGNKEDSNDSECDNDFHQTPPGEFPRNGPKSSIVAILMFYISKIITIIGLVLVARAVWFEEVRILLILKSKEIQSFFTG